MKMKKIRKRIKDQKVLMKKRSFPQDGDVTLVRTNRARNQRPGNTKGGKYQCTIDLLFDWFGLVCFANKNKNCQ
jgi:hypothetical protein